MELHPVHHAWNEGWVVLNQVRSVLGYPPEPLYGNRYKDELFSMEPLPFVEPPTLEWLDDPLTQRMEVAERKLETNLIPRLTAVFTDFYKALMLALSPQTKDDEWWMNEDPYGINDEMNQKVEEFKRSAYQQVMEQAREALRVGFASGKALLESMVDQGEVLPKEVREAIPQLNPVMLADVSPKLASTIHKLIQNQAEFLQDQVDTAIQAGDAMGNPVEAVRQEIEEYMEGAAKKAALIAETEIVRASRMGLLHAFKMSQVKEITWQSERNACAFCKRMERMVVKTGQPFFTQGETVEAEDGEGNIKKMTVNYGEITAPPFHPRCRCLIRPYFGNITGLTFQVPWNQGMKLEPKSEKELRDIKSEFDDLFDYDSVAELEMRTKIRIVHQLHQWMKVEPEKYDLDKIRALGKFLKSKGELDPEPNSYDDPIDYMGLYPSWEERAVARTIRQWAISSGEGPLAVSIQSAAKKEFRLLASSMDHFDADSTKQAADEGYLEHMDAYRGILRAQYEYTQMWLKQVWGEDHIPLFRGTQFGNMQGGDSDYDPYLLHFQKSPLQPLNSFSTDPSVAFDFTGKRFGKNYKNLIGAMIPRERILSTCQTGFGCKDEREMVVLGPMEEADSWWSILFFRGNANEIKPDHLFAIWEKAKSPTGDRKK